MTTVAPTKALPSVRYPWRTALAITVALFGTFAAIWWYLDWAAERDFQTALAETDALDPGWRLENILAARPVIPDERNAYIHLMNVKPAISGFWVGERLEQQLERPLNVRLHEEVVAAIRKHWEPLASGRRVAHQLKDMPDGVYATDYDPTTEFTLLKRLQDVRNLVFFLYIDTMLRTYDGESAEIGGACRAQINAARAMGDALSFKALLVRIACMEIAIGSLERVMAQRELPADELRAVEKVLQREIDAPKLLAAMRGERTIGLNMQAAIRDGRVNPPRLLTNPSSFSDWIANLLPASGRFDRAGYLRAMNELVEASNRPVKQQLDEMKRIGDAWRRQDTRIADIVKAFAKVVNAHARNQAKLRCAMVALAAERYRQVEGFWPRSLETLVTAEFIGAVPLDPFDGKALRSRRLGDSFIVYSVGVDRMDNGGVLNRAMPIAPGADIGFQLWDKDFRGLPAAPPAQAP